MKKFNDIVQLVKIPENYISDVYNDINSILSIKIWKYKDITLEILDNELLIKLLTKDLFIISNNEQLIFIEGTEDDLIDLYNTIIN